MSNDDGTLLKTNKKMTLSKSLVELIIIVLLVCNRDALPYINKGRKIQFYIYRDKLLLKYIYIECVECEI
jgi:hypothetical protein